MPEGYPERKAAREIERLQGQVKILKRELWRAKRAAAGDLDDGCEPQVEEEVCEERGGGEADEFF